jgi:hypothetical protein
MFFFSFLVALEMGFILVIILLSTLIRSGYNDEIDNAFITNSVFVPLVNLFFNFPCNNIGLFFVFFFISFIKVHSELYTLFEQTMLFRTAKLKVFFLMFYISKFIRLIYVLPANLRKKLLMFLKMNCLFVVVFFCFIADY